MTAQKRNHLTGALRVSKTFLCLRLQPGSNREAVITINHKGIMRVTHYSGQLVFHDTVKQSGDFVFIDIHVPLLLIVSNYLKR